MLSTEAPTAPDSQAEADFASLLTQHQKRVYLYILALVPRPVDADEILQETNLVCWRKAEQYQPDTNFSAWACRIAYYEVLKFRRRVGRSRVRFEQELVDQLSAEALEQADRLDIRREALSGCLAKLNDRDRDLVRRRYQPDATTKSVAADVSRSVKAVYNALERIYHALAECVTRTLAAEERGL